MGEGNCSLSVSHAFYFLKVQGKPNGTKHFTFRPQIQHKNQQNKAYSMCKMKYIITLETSRHLQFILNS